MRATFAGLACLVLLAARADAAPAPSIFFIDVASGPVTGGPGNLGAPISLFGRGFGAVRGASKVTIGGVEVANYMVWGQNNANNSRLDMITVQPGPGVSGGAVVVTVDGAASNGDLQFFKNNGKVLYLSPKGSDSGGCREASPCKTVLGALGSKSRPGDIILVRGGNYDEGEMWIRDEYGMSGKAAQRKTVKAYPGETPVFTNGSRGIGIDASYLTFSGLHLRKGKAIGILDNFADKSAIGRGVWIMNNTVVGPIAYDAIGTHGNDHIIAGNVVRVEASSQGTQGHCFYISHGDNVKILYNTAEGAPGYGIHLFDQVRQQKDFSRTITNLLIEGNVLTGSPERSGLLMAVEDGGDWGVHGNYMENVVVRNNVFARNNHHGIVMHGLIRNIKIYNNTFYENGRQSLAIGDNPEIKGIEVRDNLFYQSANSGACKANCDWYPIAHIQNNADGRVIIDNNGYFPGPPIILTGSGHNVRNAGGDAHAVTGNAGFVNADAMDFSLTAGSSAIDKGRSLPQVTRDFNGGIRPRGPAPDLGAFEYGSGGGAAASMSTPAPAAARKPNPDAKPSGRFEGVSGAGVASGWASDPAEADEPVKVRLYIDHNAGTPGAKPQELLAGEARSNGEPHGFSFEIPAQFRDGKPHPVWAWALALADQAKYVQLPGSPHSFTLKPSKAKKNAAGQEECGDGPIKKACICGGATRNNSFCCHGEWFSYDACRENK